MACSDLRRRSRRRRSSSTLFGASPNAIARFKEPPPEYLDDREDGDEEQEICFWRDAERGDQIEERYGERGVYADAQEKRFEEVEIIAEAAQVVEPRDVEDDDP